MKIPEVGSVHIRNSISSPYRVKVIEVSEVYDTVRFVYLDLSFQNGNYCLDTLGTPFFLKAYTHCPYYNTELYKVLVGQ